MKRNFEDVGKIEKIRAKKAQIKLMESVGIMIVFFFLLIMGMVFYSKLARIGIEQKRQENFDRLSMNTALLVSYMPELQCNAGDIGEGNQNCVDYEKVRAFSTTIDKNAKENYYYYNLFQFATVSFEQIYPEEKNTTIYDKQLPDFKTKVNTIVPVSVYYPTERRMGYGLLSIDTYCCVER